MRVNDLSSIQNYQSTDRHLPRNPPRASNNTPLQGKPTIDRAGIVQRIHIDKLNQNFEKTSRDSNAIILDALHDEVNTDGGDKPTRPLRPLTQTTNLVQRQPWKIQSSRTELFFSNSKQRLGEDDLKELHKPRSQLSAEEEEEDINIGAAGMDQEPS